MKFTNFKVKEGYFSLSSINKTRSIPVLVLVATLVGIVAMALAQNSVPVPSVQADTEGVATLSSSNIANPAIDRAWVYSDTPWEISDYDKILAISNTDSGFAEVASKCKCIVKTLDCQVVNVSTETGVLDVITPDGMKWTLPLPSCIPTTDSSYSVSVLLTAE